MKVLLVGIGAAGNKAVQTAVEQGVVGIEDSVIINSTSKDFPAGWEGEKIILSPNNTGCGKERSISRDYAMTAVSSGKLSREGMDKYTTVIVCTSVEGGTGSGSTPLIAKFYNQVYRKNVNVIAFTGFEEDVRGISNTIEFFKEVDSNLIVQAISNQSFMRQAGYNKFKAEQLANLEMCSRIRVLTGMDFIDSSQNIDDTDILKVSNTSGYMTVEKHVFDKALVDQDDFNRVIKKTIYDSHSLKSKNPGAARIGVILNIDPASEDAIDSTYESIKEHFGHPYESFTQKQWDGKKEYIAFIVSGMNMPIDTMKEIYDRYQERTAHVNKNSDGFYKEMQSMSLNSEDKKFDMLKPQESTTTIADFMSQFETK